jgi:hypothetical protein
MALWDDRFGRQRSNRHRMGLHESRNERLSVLDVCNQSMPNTPIPATRRQKDCAPEGQSCERPGKCKTEHWSVSARASCSRTKRETVRGKDTSSGVCHLCAASSLVRPGMLIEPQLWRRRHKACSMPMPLRRKHQVIEPYSTWTCLPTPCLAQMMCPLFDTVDPQMD